METVIALQKKLNGVNGTEEPMKKLVRVLVKNWGSLCRNDTHFTMRNLQSLDAKEVDPTKEYSKAKAKRLRSTNRCKTKI